MEEKKARRLLIAAAALMTEGREEGRKKEKHGRDAFSRGDGALLEALVEAWRGLAGCLGRRTRQWSARRILGDLERHERFSPSTYLGKDVWSRYAVFKSAGLATFELTLMTTLTETKRANPR
jgi:hypothetical protein